jgi:hypothetical protein
MKDVVQQLQISVVPPAVVDVVWPEPRDAAESGDHSGVHDIDSVRLDGVVSRYVWVVVGAR